MTKPKQFMFDSFDEYLEYATYIDKNHPYIEAFKMIWDMARTPSLVLEENEEKINNLKLEK